MAAYPVPDSEPPVEEGRASKRIFLMLEILMFILVIAATMNIMQKIMANISMCSLGEDRMLLYDGEMRVLSVDIARAVAEHYVGDVVFAGNSVEQCGVAYAFRKDSGEKYIVCEDGTLYQYIQDCANN